MKDMEKLEWLLEHMDEELDDAENYTWKALKCKEEHNDLARVCAELARQELTHYEMLQSLAVKCVKSKLENKDVDLQRGLAMFWEFEDSRMTKRKLNIESLLKSFHK